MEAKYFLVDVGNTHIHFGIGNDKDVLKSANIVRGDSMERAFAELVDGSGVTSAIYCSVVPGESVQVEQAIASVFEMKAVELSATKYCPIGIDYPKPETIGADRLANAIAAKRHLGAPSVVVDFGTAVTFDVVDRTGRYVGGIISPGLSAMTDYLHERTALLPRVTIREPESVIGKSTEEAMLIGAVHGYRGLIRELIHELRAELKEDSIPIVATGGDAELIASGLVEISTVMPALTLEGLRLAAQELPRNLER